jgi:hypothetical protein
MSGIKIPGYSIDGKIRHPTRSLKPHRKGPNKTDPPKTLTAYQSHETRKSTFILPEPCGKASGEIDASGNSFRLARAPVTSSKHPTPLVYFCLARGTRGALWQDREPRRPPTAAPTPGDGTDVTVHNQQEHGDHALTQHDPVIPSRRHSYLYSNGVTTIIPPNPPSLRKSGRPYRPSSTAQRRTGRSVAAAYSTSEWRGQKINGCRISAL